MADKNLEISESTQPTRRRWLRFSLRALVAFVILCALWLIWEAQFVRTRRAFIAILLNSGGEVRSCKEMEDRMQKQGILYKPAVIPWWRRLMRDEAIDTIAVPEGETDLGAQAINLFPETEIWKNYDTTDAKELLYRPARDRAAVK